MEFMGLPSGGRVKFRIGDRHRGKASNNWQQSLFFHGERAFSPRVDQHSAFAGGSAKWSGQQGAWRNQVAERVSRGIDRNTDRLPSGYGAAGQIGCEVEVFAIVACPHGNRSGWVLGRSRPQLEARISPCKNANQWRA